MMFFDGDGDGDEGDEGDGGDDDVGGKSDVDWVDNDDEFWVYNKVQVYFCPMQHFFLGNVIWSNIIIWAGAAFY